MKDVMILTGVSLQKREEKREEDGRLLLAATQLRNVGGAIRKHSLKVGVIVGVISFLRMLDFEIFGSIMAIVSLLALWMSEEGGRK